MTREQYRIRALERELASLLKFFNLDNEGEFMIGWYERSAVKEDARRAGRLIGVKACQKYKE